MKPFNSLPSHYRASLAWMPEDVLVHEFYHFRGETKVVHGWVVVNKSGRVIGCWNPSGRSKAQMVLDYAAKCVGEV
jgi:hypothetical protein